VNIDFGSCLPQGVKGIEWGIPEKGTKGLKRGIYG
jgi:hypothetical protein